MKAPWPLDLIKKRPLDPEAEMGFRTLEQAVGGIRELRANLNLPPGKTLKAVIRYRSEEACKALQTLEKEIRQLGRLESLELRKEFQRTASYVGHASKDLEVFIKIEGVIDPEKERARLEKKIQDCIQYLETVKKKLGNPSFVENAPEELVAEERGKLLDLESLLKTHQGHLSLFK
jgi:valyl-tRNA synthetase